MFLLTGIPHMNPRLSLCVLGEKSHEQECKYLRTEGRWPAVTPDAQTPAAGVSESYAAGRTRPAVSF